ncbi:YdeI/OmpD-associated family protein [Chryseobacterium oleae]|nr:YdeI/OmpD-associated family protein [Chryseobacterium oleae]
MKNSSFTALLEIIGINPFVFVPDEILNEIFKAAGKDKSPIPVKGTVNGKEFQQNLMKYLGEWRLYVNLLMLKNSPKRIGETLEIVLEFDESDRRISIHPRLDEAIKGSPIATRNFENLIPSRRNELIRYINNLKTEASIERNIEKIMRHLHGETDFFGKRID